MAELIERMGSQTVVKKIIANRPVSNGRPIDLSELVNMGAEIIDIGAEYAAGKSGILQRAISTAVALATEYGCRYVLLGQQPPYLEGHWVFIASFYNDRK